MEDFVQKVAHRTGWTGISVKGPPLRIPTDLVSDPVPQALGSHPVIAMEAGVAACSPNSPPWGSAGVPRSYSA